MLYGIPLLWRQLVQTECEQPASSPRPTITANLTTPLNPKQQGEVLGGRLRHGTGTHSGASDGSRYSGAWRLDERHGRGTFEGADGARYEGEWRHDRAHG